MTTRNLLVILIVLGVIAGVVGFVVALKNPPAAPAAGVTYDNSEYGFSVALPDSWNGYTIVTDTWEGYPAGSEDMSETGPMISIRHPLWSKELLRQDIPTMIFTKAEWNAMQNGEFHIGTAPVPPSELARNERYVFALPARYNYAFPLGYEEVDALIQASALRAY